MWCSFLEVWISCMNFIQYPPLWRFLYALNFQCWWIITEINFERKGPTLGAKSDRVSLGIRFSADYVRFSLYCLSKHQITLADFTILCYSFYALLKLWDITLYITWTDTSFFINKVLDYPTGTQYTTMEL